MRSVRQDMRQDVRQDDDEHQHPTQFNIPLNLTSHSIQHHQGVMFKTDKNISYLFLTMTASDTKCSFYVSHSS